MNIWWSIAVCNQKYDSQFLVISCANFPVTLFLDWGKIQTKKLIAGEAYMQVKTTQSLYNENSFPVQHPND